MVEGLRDYETMSGCSNPQAPRSAAAGCQISRQPAAQVIQKQQPIYQRMQAAFNMLYKTKLKPAAERELDAKIKGQATFSKGNSCLQKVSLRLKFLMKDLYQACSFSSC